MSDLTLVGILLLSMLIMAFLQLTPGIFMLFSHYKLGQMSRNKASGLSTFFILGAETFVVIIFFVIYIIFSSLPVIFEIAQSSVFDWIASGILIAIAILFILIYYRKGSGTELFVSRNFANHISSRIKTAKTRSDAFLLGFFASIPELIFTFPLYFLANFAIIDLASTPIECSALIIIFALISILPLFVIHFFFATQQTIAPLMRFRFKNKSFFRFVIPFFYCFIAVLIILGVLL